jgi:hypothetical protein
MKKQITGNNNFLINVTKLLAWEWTPWVVSITAVLTYGIYLLAAGHQLIINDFFGHVWMALEDREGGLGSSTNSVIPAGYPILLNIFHSFGFHYMKAGCVLTLVAAVPILVFVWRGASRWGEFPWAGFVAWLLMATSYQFILTLATPLPDLIALSMVLPLIILVFKPDRPTRILILSAFFAGLACSIRYTFIQSVVPLTILLLLFSHTVPWGKRIREALIIAAGLAVGLLPEIIFALRAGHIPFQNSSKYYLTLIVGEADFLMCGTQLRNMPSTIDYIMRHSDKILPAWGYGFIYNFAIFVLVPAVILWLTEKIGTTMKQERVNAQIRRELISLLIFETILLIPISLRQPVPYYVIPLLLGISVMIAAIPVVKLASINKPALGVLVICLSAVSIFQVRSAVQTLQENRFIALNTVIAGELYGLGARDSAEVLNLAAPFALYWPYGDKSPLLYYTLKEPGWLCLTNTLGQKRPFIYQLTKNTTRSFHFVLTRAISSVEKEEFLSEFELERQIGGVQIYKIAISK